MIESSQFHHDFWTYYAECYPDDGVTRGRAANHVHHRVEDENLLVAQFLAWYKGSAGVYIRKALKTDSHKSVFELVEPYEPALIEALHVNLDQPPAYFKIKYGKFYAHMETPVDRRDSTTWSEAADWLHEHLLIYRDALTETPACKS